jgi:3',5'-cyclic AMP phosphodiesterase CpdA
MRPECNLIHLTDFHLFQARGASLRDFLNKRLLSYLSWRLFRGNKNSPRRLDEVLAFLPSRAWDQMVITGDLTHLGLPLEFQRARSYLARFGPPERVFVIPGNHDAMLRARSATYADLWGAYMASDEAYRNSPAAGSDFYPTVRIRNGIALIGLSSARPTPPFSAAGRLGQAQRRRLVTILAETGRQRLFRVLLVHHPLLAGQVKPRKRMRDAAVLRDILGRYGAELVLHGHTHRHSHACLPGPVEPIPVLGLPSTTAVGTAPEKRACLRIYSIRTVNDGWRIEIQDHRASANGFMGPMADLEVPAVWHTGPNTAA